MSWLSDYLTGDNPTAERLLASIGAILSGHVTFTGDDPNRGIDNEGAFGGRYDGPFFVLTHRPAIEAPAGVVFVDDLRTAVTLAKETAGDKYVCILGANVAKQCIEAGLLDEILMFFAPVLLGDGVRIFDKPGGAKVRLAPVSGETAHWYTVLG